MAQAVTSHSLVPSLSTDTSKSFSGTISDTSDPGVYIAEMFVPKRQPDGVYDYNVVLNGLVVPTPQVLIRPCTNTLALSMGQVAAPDNWFDKGVWDYIIGEAMQIVDLPTVAIYCEQ